MDTTPQFAMDTAMALNLEEGEGSDDGVRNRMASLTWREINKLLDNEEHGKKHFLIGQWVRLGGSNSGLSGYVLDVNGDSALFVQDGLSNLVVVNVKDIFYDKDGLVTSVLSSFPVTHESGSAQHSNHQQPFLDEDSGEQWLMPDIMVNVSRPGEKPPVSGVIREVFADGSCSVAICSSGKEERVTCLPSEIEKVVPKKTDRVKITRGGKHGTKGKLVGIIGNDEGLVCIFDSSGIPAVYAVEMAHLAKLAEP